MEGESKNGIGIINNKELEKILSNSDKYSDTKEKQVPLNTGHSNNDRQKRSDTKSERSLKNLEYTENTQKQQYHYSDAASILDEVFWNDDFNQTQLLYDLLTDNDDCNI